jgi:hypothetical protein
MASPRHSSSEDDQRALGGHIEAHREAEYLDAVERDDEGVDDVAEEEPQRHHDDHESACSFPMFVFAG